MIVLRGPGVMGMSVPDDRQAGGAVLVRGAMPWLVMPG